MKPFSRTIALWVSVLGLFLLEFVLFDRFGSHRVTAIYPRWNDQIQYLSECYTGYEFARSHGIWKGLWQTLVNPSAQGTLHDVAAVIVFQFSGPSRSAALALAMLALITWQLALFLVMTRRSGSAVTGFAVAMLPLALRGPWENVPGSAYDFRLDHFAMCAFGVAGTIALLTSGFRVLRWSLAFGLAVGITLLTRFLTGTYFLVIFVALAAWIFAGTDRGTRIRNLLLSGCVAAAIAGPIFWLNREWVWNYYYVGHYVGPESAIRNQNFGLIRSTQFVWGWLAERHLGTFWASLAGSAAFALTIARLLTPDGRAASAAQTLPSGNESREPLGDVAVIGTVFLLAPALVLTLHPQKSEVVISALVPGTVLLVAALWSALARLCLVSAGVRRAVARVTLGAVVGATLLYFGQRQLRPLEDAARLADMRQVNALADYILTRSEAARLDKPRVSVDNITDALDAQVLRVICYERHHVWKDFDMKLPTGIAEPDAALVRQRITESDFVFISNDGAPPAGPFPYDRKLFQLRPELRAWCDAHFTPVKRFVFSGHPVVLYERPEVFQAAGVLE